MLSQFFHPLRYSHCITLITTITFILTIFIHSLKTDPSVSDTQANNMRFCQSVLLGALTLAVTSPALQAAPVFSKPLHSDPASILKSPEPEAQSNLFMKHSYDIKGQATLPKGQKFPLPALKRKNRKANSKSQSSLFN